MNIKIFHLLSFSGYTIEVETKEVSFISEIRGEGKYPSGESLGSGIMAKYPHGIIERHLTTIETYEFYDSYSTIFLHSVTIHSIKVFGFGGIRTLHVIGSCYIVFSFSPALTQAKEPIIIMNIIPDLKRVSLINASENFHHECLQSEYYMYSNKPILELPLLSVWGM